MVKEERQFLDCATMRRTLLSTGPIDDRDR